jgi:Rieske Fe-S protein
MSELLLISRRSLLGGALVTAAAGVIGYVVAANSSAARASKEAATANAYGPNPSGGGRRLADVAQVPPGGGIVLDAPKIVLSRSQTGDVHGFSAVCTHQGCVVSSVQNGQIICPCHGSRFDAQTGRVITGPATAPLPSVAVTVHDGGVYSA